MSRRDPARRRLQCDARCPDGLLDQALDIGLLTPCCVITGVLLLRREGLGYLLSSSSLVLFVCLGLSVMAGEVMLGLSIGRISVAGLAVFSLFIAAALWLLVSMLAGMRRTRRQDSR